jgi:hypothetical protein
MGGHPVSSALEIRKTGDGRVQARRKDGLPLTPEDRQAAKEIIAQVSLPPRAWIVEQIRDDATGKLVGTKICSAVLASHLWLLHDPDFVPPDNDPVFFESELEFLKNKPIDKLKRLLEYKTIFPRCRIIQEGPRT